MRFLIIYPPTHQKSDDNRNASLLITNSENEIKLWQSMTGRISPANSAAACILAKAAPPPQDLAGSPPQNFASCFPQHCRFARFQSRA